MPRCSERFSAEPTHCKNSCSSSVKTMTSVSSVLLVTVPVLSRTMVLTRCVFQVLTAFEQHPRPRPFRTGHDRRRVARPSAGYDNENGNGRMSASLSWPGEGRNTGLEGGQGSKRPPGRNAGHFVGNALNIRLFASLLPPLYYLRRAVSCRRASHSSALHAADRTDHGGTD